MWGNLVFGGTAGLFLFWALFCLWHLRWVRRLPKTPVATAAKLPRCSVVMAGRDEEARIEQSVHRLFAQTGVELEFIVVDDRSTDRTPEILSRLALEDARLRVKRIDVLPEGWLGKCHACHIGASEARFEWILFTDADCWLHPNVVSDALQLAERDRVDQVTLISGLRGGYTLKAAHLMFVLSFANWISGLNRDHPRSYLGIGAFNLVRASAYRECGGYEALRLTVVDDMKLGLLLRRAGKRARAFMGCEEVECYWGTRAWGMVKLMEKNYFAILDYRLWLVMGGCAFVLIVLGLLAAGLISGTALGFIAALSPLSNIVPAALLARRIRWPVSTAILSPFMLLLFWYALLNSTIVTLRNGGVRWRETFYPLKTLKAGTVR